jgi:hypothetical protein
MFNNASIDQVLINNLIHIFPTFVGIPYTFRIDDDDGTFTTSIQTPRGVDPDLALPTDSELLGTLFCIIAHLGSIVIIAADAVLSIIGAKKHMVFIK